VGGLGFSLRRRFDDRHVKESQQFPAGLLNCRRQPLGSRLELRDGDRIPLLAGRLELLLVAPSLFAAGFDFVVF